LSKRGGATSLKLVGHYRGLPKWEGVKVICISISDRHALAFEKKRGNQFCRRDDGDRHTSYLVERDLRLFAC